MRRILLIPAALLFVTAVTCAPHDETIDRKSTVESEAVGLPAKKPLEIPKALKPRLEAALEHVRQRDLLTTHAFWTIFHGILGNGLDTMLFDEATGKRFNAIEHIRKGGDLRGMRFIPMRDKNGFLEGLDVQMGPLSVGQGHQDQFVAEMLQWGLPASATFMVNGTQYTFEDFLRWSRAFASTTQKQELSWAILIIGQQYGTDHQWTNSAGEKLHFEDVVRYEVDQPIEGAACGGTHRLFGLTWAYHLHRNKGGAKAGVWKDVADRLAKYKELAKKLQNPDGSFSTDWFAGPGDARDTNLRIGTTGHILEWLALVMTDEELRAPWMLEAVNSLTQMILERQFDPVDGGSLYHATHGLHIYHSRVFGPPIPILPLPPRD